VGHGRWAVCLHKAYVRPSTLSYPLTAVWPACPPTSSRPSSKPSEKTASSRQSFPWRKTHNSILAHRISGKQNKPNVMKPEIIKPLNFRCALVIEQTDSLRMSLVQALKAKGWFVHGIRRPEQAFHILAHIPYRLVVIGSELPGISGIDFVRILRNSREWRTIPAVVITSSQSVDFATQAAECGAFLAKKSTWKDDLFSFLSGYD
jgi:CheY-like chemotaxis protein